MQRFYYKMQHHRAEQDHTTGCTVCVLPGCIVGMSSGSHTGGAFAVNKSTKRKRHTLHMSSITSSKDMTTLMKTHTRTHSHTHHAHTHKHTHKTHVACELQVLLKERLHGTDVLPVAVEGVGHDVHGLHRKEWSSVCVLVRMYVCVCVCVHMCVCTCIFVHVCV